MIKNNVNKPSGQTALYSCLLIITLVAIVLIGEITARLLIKENSIPEPPPVNKIDPYSTNPYILGMRPFLHFHIPGSHYIQSRSYYAVDYHINSSGFRGPEILPKAEGANRLIVIGDSIVEGHGSPFEETFPSRLNQKAENIQWDVINLGVMGASPLYFAANMERYLSTDPDLALIVMFENDLFDDRVLERDYFTKPVMDNPNRLYANQSNAFFLSDYSKLSLLLKRASYRIKQQELVKIIQANRGIDISNEEQKKLDKMSPWLVAPSMIDRQWEMSRRYLNYTVHQFRSREIPVFFVFLSLGALAPGLDPAYGAHAHMMDNKVRTWAEDNEVPFLSLLPLISELMATMPTSEIMIEDDGHPTPKAHSIITERLWNWLLQNSKK